MPFIITSNPKGPCAMSPLWWNGNVVVGRLRANEAVRYNTVEDAFRILNNDITDDQRRFYDLVVVENLFAHDLNWQPPRRC